MLALQRSRRLSRNEPSLAARSSRRPSVSPPRLVRPFLFGVKDRVRNSHRAWRRTIRLRFNLPATKVTTDWHRKRLQTHLGPQKRQ